MTPANKELDPSSLFKTNSLRLYRLAKMEYANLSGIGAATEGGRWNRIGQEAIYTSTEIGTPWLERLVHTPKDVIPRNLGLMEILIDVADPYPGVPPPIHVFPSLAAAKQAWRETTDPNSRWAPMAIAVPSVVVPVWNVVLYPGAFGFWDRVSLVSIEPVEFDPRLFPKNAVQESI